MSRGRQRRVLDFLTVGEQIRIEDSRDFQILEAFPPRERNINDIDRIKDLCRAVTEASSMLEEDTRKVHDTENDVKAMIDDWKTTDDELSAIVGKLENIKLEHADTVSSHAEKAITGISNLRIKLTETQSERIQKRCSDTVKDVSRLQYIKNSMNKSREIAEQSALCSICISNPIKTYLTPCGHVFCQSCAEKSGEWCFVCRGRIHRRMPLYY
ncbi:RING-finger domain-containing protein [Tetraselmis virus 1]|uniref:RING-finger domain-containing protein n=1 Tax=Tetraselmis virus 1 TaxID=2060617 RepID=A0A2P0VNN1_9VIRU|nr:RING-finger domain-containing protein [Tetraselmis virus 1]AUF82515.1 RING-finger domain-containing protein [Tetraselmis virus 1]